MEDLKARLRKVESSREYAGANVTTNWHRNPDGPEAADRIEALEALLGECRLQLEHLDARSPTGTTPAVIARIDALLQDKG